MIWRPRLVLPWYRDRGVEDREENMKQIERAVNGIPIQLDADNILYVQLQGTVSQPSAIVNIGPLAAWTTWPSTVTSSIGTITTVGSQNNAYMRIGRTIIWRTSITITTNGTGAGVLLVTLPFACTGVNVYLGAGSERGVTGKQLQVYSNTTTAAAIVFYDATYPGANGAIITVGGTYEAAA